MKYLLLAALLAVSACAPKPQEPDIVTRTDEFSKDITVYGHQAYDKDSGVKWQLQSRINKTTKAVSHVLNVSITYHSVNRLSFNQAADQYATSLKVKQGYKTGWPCLSGRCAMSNTFDIILNGETLKQNMQQGYRIKITASNKNEIIVLIAPESIREQLDEVAKYTR